MNEVRTMKKILITIAEIIGIGILLGILYMLYIMFGIVGTIIALGVLAGTCFMNERHNPLVLYYKNYGKRKDDQ